MKRWEDTFVDDRLKIINGRLGCFMKDNGTLYFSVRTTRSIYIAVKFTEKGISISKISGKKSYTNDDVIACANKVKEIVEDFERWQQL